MTLESILVLLLLGAAVVLFITEKLPVDLVALIIMGTLMVMGIVSVAEGLSGFSNRATVTIGAMFVLSAGLFRTGAVNFVGNALTRVGKHSFWAALILMMIGVGTISAFINNTPVVAIFLPIMLGVARNLNVSASKLLMPLSFATMFGGVCTLIGTSTNILVSSIAEQHGQPPFTMFEFSSLGLIFFGAGVLYMAVIGVRLIPNRRRTGDLTQSFGLGDYLTEIILQPEAQSVGKPLQDSPLVHELDLDIIEIYREGQLLSLPAPETVLQAGDMLRVRCNVERIRELQDRKGIVLKSRAKWQDQDLQSAQAMLVEAVIAPNSVLEGKSLKQIKFRNVFNATALAIRHRGELLHERLGTTRLRAGDALLIEVRRDHLDRLKRNAAFVLVSEVDLPEFRPAKMVPAFLIIIGVVVTASFNLLPIAVSAIAGAVLLILTGCLSLEEAYKAIEWKVIFLLAGVLPLGIALEKTGAALFVANGMISVVGIWGPVALVSALYFLTMILTSAMSNTATAALLTPISIVTAQTLGVSPRPFLMAVTFAASLDFMTPVGYQTNTLIYGPGHYKFVDFIRVGTPLNLMFWLLATLLIPRLWPF